LAQTQEFEELAQEKVLAQKAVDLATQAKEAPAMASDGLMCQGYKKNFPIAHNLAFDLHSYLFRETRCLEQEPRESIVVVETPDNSNNPDNYPPIPLVIHISCIHGHTRIVLRPSAIRSNVLRK
jgi:hypothetical protein